MPIPYAAYKSFKLEKGLALEERPRETSLTARMYLNGKTSYVNTETTDYERAARIARSKFYRLRDDRIPGSREHVTMHAAAKAFIADIRNVLKREYHQEKWNAISDFFKTVDATAVDTPLLKKFMRWDRNGRPPVTSSTLKKDFSTIRQILRHAVEEGWLTAPPLFPRVESSGTNPRPWFQPDQWQHLLDIARERVEGAHEEAGRHRHQRQDVLDFIQLQIATCMRVGELRSVRRRDVQVRRKNSTPVLLFDVKGNCLGEAPNEYLEIELQLPDAEHVSAARLKRGVHTVVTRVALSGVQTFRDRVAREGLKRDDLLFPKRAKRGVLGEPTSLRDGFRELLDAADLRTAGGIKRNLKSVRCTALMFWILAEPSVNLMLLADNAGTSVQMLSSYYLKPLNVKLNRAGLVG